MKQTSVAQFLFFTWVVGLGLTAFFIFPPYGMDDCYITYRYAYNLFHHRQFVFNPGERVLGTTSPLYTLLLTVLQICSNDIPLMSNVVSCLCSALAGFILFLILKKDNLPLGVFCAVSYPFILQDIGLETNFLMFLFAAAAYLFARERLLLCSTVLGLCFLTRQDSAVFIATMILIFWLKKKKLPWKEFGVFGCIIAPWFIFCYFYFDTLFPASLQAKKGYTASPDYFLHALSYLGGYCDRYNLHLLSRLSRTLSPLLLPGRFLSHTSAGGGLGLLYLFFIFLALIYYLKHIAQHHYTGGLFYLYPLSMIVTLSIIGPPAPPGHAWHLTSAINFALIGQLNLFTTPLLHRLKRRSTPLWSSRASAVLGGCICVYLLCFALLNLKDFYTAAKEADRSFWFGARYHNYRHIGLFLKDAVSDEEKVFVLEVGTIGYYSMKRMIDGAGLISPGYAPYHRNGCWLLGMERAFPDYIVTWDMAIPFYHPVYRFQNDFGEMVVYKKADNLPYAAYPFEQLRNNFNQWKEGRRRRHVETTRSSPDAPF